MVSLTFTGQIHHSLGNAQQLSYTYMLLTSGISCCWSALCHCVFVASCFLVFELCYTILTVATPVFKAGCLKSNGTGSNLCVLEDNISQLLFYNHIQQLPSIEKGFVGGVEHYFIWAYVSQLHMADGKPCNVS